MTKMELADVSMDTLHLLSKEKLLLNGVSFPIRNWILDSISRSEILPASKDIVTAQNVRFNHQQYVVGNMTTTDAVYQLLEQGYKKVAALNFASAIKAGGGWLNGRTAQEEDIMRKTTAFPALVVQDAFYQGHSVGNPFYSDAIIYTPDVAIIKDDDFQLVHPRFFDLYTCAAINKKAVMNNNQLNQWVAQYSTTYHHNLVLDMMYLRIKKILKFMELKGEENLVLGAFGCGVFGNEASDIAEIFRIILKDEGLEKVFETIIFAVFDNSVNQDNLKAFQNLF